MTTSVIIDFEEEMPKMPYYTERGRGLSKASPGVGIIQIWNTTIYSSIAVPKSIEKRDPGDCRIVAQEPPG